MVLIEIKILKSLKEYYIMIFIKLKAFLSLAEIKKKSLTSKPHNKKQSTSDSVAVLCKIKKISRYHSL